MADVRIRLASTEDAAPVAQLMTGLNDAVGPEGGLPATPDNIAVTPAQAASRMAAMAPHEQVLLAFDNQAAVGLLSLRIMPYLAEDTPHAEVTELFVVESHRRGGVATALMREAEHIARARGSREIHVRAWHENDVAHRFYEGIGCSPLEACFHLSLMNDN
jgi:ribosomal protein S18 acetylase RimI-like enzyme